MRIDRPNAPAGMAAVLLAFLVASPSPAAGGNATRALSVGAVVEPACRASTGPAASASAARDSLQVSCSAGAGWTASVSSAEARPEPLRSTADEADVGRPKRIVVTVTY